MTIAFDFDGVIHKFRNGLQNGELYDEPNLYMLDLINDLIAEGHYVYIMSTRSSKQIKKYIKKYGYPLLDYPVKIIPFWRKFWTKKYVLGITNKKIYFDILLDDNTIRFNPDQQPTKQEILNFKPFKFK